MFIIFSFLHAIIQTQKQSINDPPKRSPSSNAHTPSPTATIQITEPDLLDSTSLGEPPKTPKTPRTPKTPEDLRRSHASIASSVIPEEQERLLPRQSSVPLSPLPPPPSPLPLIKQTSITITTETINEETTENGDDGEQDQCKKACLTLPVEPITTNGHLPERVGSRKLSVQGE